ncbi:MAG TPA: class D sortase [Bryobacteraceae bacterium]|jgi:sortase A|nr:class D sortase [Bryobacteraceae bacterium]
MSPKSATARLRWTLLSGGILLLGYCGFVMADARMFQYRENAEMQRLLVTPGAPGAPPAMARSGLIGRIEVPRLGLSAVVMEGDDAATLRRAVGHIPGTALPGQSGNTGVSAHRDTFFRPLKDIRTDDEISVTTLEGEFRYRVVSTEIVSPDDVDVLAPTSKEALTLVTCYPFYFVGSAPKRFIVRAERVFSQSER